MEYQRLGTLADRGRWRGGRRLCLGGLLLVAGLAFVAFGSSAAPTVSILSPLEGASINSGTVEITLDIQGITMNGSAIGLQSVAGEGHYHIYLDNFYLRPDFVSATFLSNVGTGPHVLRIEIAENNHTEIGARDSVNITILSGAPRVLITSPGPSPVVWGSGSAELNLATGNFTLNGAAIGGTPVAGEGHYRVIVDGLHRFSAATPWLNVSSLQVGRENVIRIELAGNDGSPLSDPAFDELRITPSGGVPELILWPSIAGSLVNASSLSAPLGLSNFTLAAGSMGGTPVAGFGHYRVFLDGADLGPAGENPLLLADLGEGNHTFVVELRANDYSPLSPRVVAWTTFTVASGAPRVTITSPVGGSNVNATSVELALQVANFALAPSKIGQAPAGREGHWHLFVDGAYRGFGGEAVALASDLTEGAHLLLLELHQNDHTNFTWAPFDFVRIVVRAGAPSLTITSPASGTLIASSSVALSLAVNNFVLDPAAVGQLPVAGRGHWHIFVDGAYRAFGTTLAATATRLTPGTHTIVVELYNNDHSDLTWPAFDQITVSVPAGSPSVSFVFPTPASSLPLNFTTLRVAVANFSVVDKPGQTPVVGEGHWHIFVDSVFYGMAYAPSAVVEGLAPGEHTIRAVLVGNNHAFLSPSVVDEVTVTIGGLRPTIQITSPADGTFLYADTTTLSVNIVNFTLAPGKISQAPVMGEGHYHVFIDGAYLTFVATPTYTLTGLALGDHTVSVQLYNNDHTPLDIRVVSSIVLRVAGDPQLTISSPLNGTVSSDTSVTLSISVANFTLEPVPTTAAANAPGHGHYHIWLDGVFHSMATGPDATVPNLAVGPHIVEVRLVNNDHTELGTENSSAAVTVTIVEPAAPPAKGFLPGFDGAAVVAAVAAVAAAAVCLRTRKRR